MVESTTSSETEPKVHTLLPPAEQPEAVAVAESNPSTVMVVSETLQNHLDLCERHGASIHKKLPSLVQELKRLEDKQVFIQEAWCRQAYLYCQQEESRQILAKSLLECEMIDNAIKKNRKDIKYIKKRIRKIAKKLPKQTQHKSNLPNILSAVSEKN